MATIHCMCGYIGFGKTSIAKKLETLYNAKRFTPDEIMIQLYGTEIGTDFMSKAEQINTYIWSQIEKCVKRNQDVIYDTGSWGVEDRRYVMKMAHKFNADVVWHQIQCDIQTAKKRALNRTSAQNELSVSEAFFDENLEKYVPIQEDEHLNVIYHMNN